MKRKLIFLKSSEDFSKLHFPHPAYSNPFLRIRVGKVHQNTPRFGFIVPKKTVNKVVDRNLIKRRLKGILAKNIEHLRIADVLIFPNKQAIKIPFAELEDQVIILFKKAGLWKQ